jgi:hypothetical protein
MNPGTRKKLIGILLPLFFGVIFVQTRIDPIAADMRKGEKTVVTGLSNEFILGPLLGMQQAVAGLLWVRADEFFHEGDYDAILPIVRMVTWLDPHQLDVFITGAWHLSYNFTDANERSDRRYIPAAQALLREGDAANDAIYDIAFELGWQNIDKIKNYAEAEVWFRKCTKRKATNDAGEPVKDAPMFVWHQLAHSLERQDRIPEAAEVWKQALAKTEKQLADKPNDWSIKNVRDSERHNLELTLKRWYSKREHQIDFELDRKTTKSVNMTTGEPTPRDSYVFLTAEEVANRQQEFKDLGAPVPPMAVGQPRPPAVVPPWDVAFDAKVKFTSPKVFEPSGQFNVGDGARVTIRLHDDNFSDKTFETFSFNIDQSQTIMVDQHSVKNGRWGRKIDMSKDPKMYGFNREYYYIVFEFNPRGTSPFIQDRFGYSGEGMSDKKYNWDDTSKTPKLRLIRKVFKVSRAQIMGEKPVTDADVISNEEYDRVQKSFAPAPKPAVP